MNCLTQPRALLLLGPSGSGKTPLGQWLEHHGLHGLRCHHFDFGACLRAIAANSGTAGFTISEIAFIRDVLEKGALLENEHFYLAARILQSFIASRTTNSADWIILNGLPRHAGQAEALVPLVQVAAVVSLECNLEVMIQRIRQNSGGDRAERADDADELIRRKLAIFTERTQLLVQHYRRRGVPLISVEIGVHTQPEDVANQLKV